MNFYGAPAVDKSSLQGQPGYPSSGYPPSQAAGLVQGASLTQARYPGPAGAMGQQYAGVQVMSTTAPAMQGYSSISGYPPAAMPYPSSMTSAGVQFRSAQPVPHPSLQTMPSTTLAYPASQYPSMAPSYLASHQLQQAATPSYPHSNPVMSMPAAVGLAHQGGFQGVSVTSVPRGFPVGAHSTIPAGHPSSLSAGMTPLGYPSGYPGQGSVYPSSNGYGGRQYPGI